MDIIPTPKRNVIMDATVLTALESCETYLDLRFNHNLIPITGKGNPLDAGVLVHLILQEYNKALIAGQSRVNAISIGMQAGHKFYTTESTNIPIDNVKNKNGHLKEVGYNYIVQTMEEYFERWKNNSWTPIEAERVRGQILYEDDEIRVLYKAKIDLMVDTHQDGIVVKDYKTMKQRKEVNSLNNQFRGQCLVTGTKTVYVEKIGWQQNLKPEEKFTIQPISYSGAILAEQIQKIGYFAKVLVSLDDSKYYPRRFSFCDKYGGCIFRFICEADPTMRQGIINQHFIVGEEWDPGEEIEKEEVNDYS